MTKERRRRPGNYRTTHGCSVAGAITPEYAAWGHMKSRCLSPANTYYADYGGRGITVCQQWIDSFQSFLADVGSRPSAQHSLDRINNDGNYEPGNVRWALSDVQQNNKRNTTLITAFGQTMSIPQWSRYTGIPKDTIRYRLSQGRSMDGVFSKEHFRSKYSEWVRKGKSL